jgi:hypothetical protein
MRRRRITSRRTTKTTKITRAITRRVRRRISKMKCQRMTRKNSNLPPFEARTCPDKIRKGKDGMYKSITRNNGVWVWTKI